MKYILYFASIILLFYLNISCKSDTKPLIKEESSVNKKSINNLNLSIFLDLSDRIDPKKNSNETMEIYQRDIGYITSIGEAFQEHLNKSKINSMNDQIQLFFEPEPKDIEINDLAKKMKFVLNKSTVTRNLIDSISTIYNLTSNKIYQIALKESKYIGADIWHFFKNTVKDQCIKPNHRNILIIITDGYMFHQNNQLRIENETSYLTPELIKNAQLNHHNFASQMDKNKLAFIPATSGLQDLKVLVLGINPQKGRDFEEDIIKKYWGDWLNKMGVVDFEIKGIDLPTYMDTIIKNRILNK